MSDGWVWGVDPGNLRCGLAMVEIPSGRFATYAVQWRWEREKYSLPLSLLTCRAEVHPFARRLADVHPPATVAVELPTGRFRNPPLMFHTAILLDTLHVALGLAPWLISVTDWKSHVSGNGQWPRANLLGWAADLGYPTADVDQAAALAIAAGAAHAWAQFEVDRLHPMMAPAG